MRHASTASGFTAAPAHLASIMRTRLNRPIGGIVSQRRPPWRVSATRARCGCTQGGSAGTWRGCLDGYLANGCEPSWGQSWADFAAP
jgi:hypothetical protein